MQFQWVNETVILIEKLWSVSAFLYLDISINPCAYSTNVKRWDCTDESYFLHEGHRNTKCKAVKVCERIFHLIISSSQTHGSYLPENTSRRAFTKSHRTSPGTPWWWSLLATGEMYRKLLYDAIFYSFRSCIEIIIILRCEPVFEYAPHAVYAGPIATAPLPFPVVGDVI